MRLNAGCLLLCVLVVAGSWVPVRAQNSESAIRKVLTDQQSAWNRGDINAFMHGYDDSPETTFIGKTVQRGYQMILARYQRNYGSREAMGQLEFSELEVRMLGTEHAVATGHFHLTRTPGGGGDAAGVFSLVLKKKRDGWKIILDHTST